MRKATVFTIIFVLLTLTLTHGVNAADCIVVNDCAHNVRVAYATWMEADEKYPEGYRVTGWFYINPGKKRTFSAKYDIYVRVEGIGRQDQFHTFKPPGAAEEDSYQFWVYSTENFTVVETDDGTVIYSSVQRSLLSGASNFYMFAQDATFKVTEVGHARVVRESKEVDAANASTYACTAPTTGPEPPPKGQTYGENGQAVTKEHEAVLDVEKTAVTTIDDLWTYADTESSVDDMIGGPVILTVAFSDRRSEFFSEEKAETIEKIASVWALYGNIKFDFVKSGTADIYINLEPRIATDENGKIVTDEYNRPVRVAEYSSYIGKGAKGKEMNLCFTDWENTSYERKKRVILHEFGHALGFHHEHKNINLPIEYNIPDVLAYYKDTQGWDADTTTNNVFGALDTSKWHFTEFDPNSIMLYPIQQFQEFNGKMYQLTFNPINFTYNSDLSKIDQAAIRRMYPGRPTESGNGLKTKKYEYSVSGKGKLRFGSLKSSYKDWNRKFDLPRGTIKHIRNVTTRAHKGYVKQWALHGTNKIMVAGKIEPGAMIYGKVDGYLEVVYLPE